MQSNNRAIRLAYGNLSSLVPSAHLLLTPTLIYRSGVKEASS
jgi:hypothetical protein